MCAPFIGLILAFPNAFSEDTYEDMKELLLRHFKPVDFEAGVRTVFHCPVSQDDQSIREFIHNPTLKRLVLISVVTYKSKCRIY